METVGTPEGAIARRHRWSLSKGQNHARGSERDHAGASDSHVAGRIADARYAMGDVRGELARAGCSYARRDCGRSVLLHREFRMGPDERRWIGEAGSSA